MKLAPLYSALTELSIYAKISIVMKNCEQSLFLEPVTIIIYLILLCLWGDHFSEERVIFLTIYAQVIVKRIHEIRTLTI